MWCHNMFHKLQVFLGNRPISIFISASPPWASMCPIGTMRSEIADVRHVGVRDLSSHRLGRHHWRRPQRQHLTSWGHTIACWRWGRHRSIKQAQVQCGAAIFGIFKSPSGCVEDQLPYGCGVACKVAVQLWQLFVEARLLPGPLLFQLDVARLSPAGRGQSFPLQDQQACTGNPSVPLVPWNLGFQNHGGASDLRTALNIETDG